jgi:hypothetical protein
MTRVLIIPRKSEKNGGKENGELQLFLKQQNAQVKTVTIGNRSDDQFQ